MSGGNSPADHALIPGEIVDLVARSEIKGIKEDVHQLDRKIDGLASKGDIRLLSETIGSIAAKQDRAAQPNWSILLSAFAIGLTFLGIVGGFAYWPIISQQNDLKDTVKTLASGVVYQRRYDNNQANTDTRFRDIERELELLRLRSYDQYGALSRLEERTRAQEKTIDIFASRINDLRNKMQAVR